MKIVYAFLVAAFISAAPVAAQDQPAPVAQQPVINVLPAAPAKAPIVAPAGTTQVIEKDDGTVVFLRPLIMEVNTWLAQFLSLVVAGVLTLAYRRISNYFGVKENNEEKDRAIELIRKSVEYQAGKVIAKLDGTAMTAAIDVHSEGIAEAVNTIISRLPAEAAKANATPEKVADMVVGMVGAMQAAGPTVTPAVVVAPIPPVIGA